MEENFGFEEHEFNEGLKQTLDRFKEMITSGKEYFFDVDQFEDLIDYFLDRGEFESSGEVLEHALKQHPFSNSIKIRLAQQNFAGGQINNALSILNQTEKIEPLNEDIILLKAEIFSQMRNHKKALQYYSKALERATFNKVEIMIDMALELEEMQRYGKAIEVLQDLIIIDPENEIALHEINHCFIMSEQPENGVDFFVSFVDEHPFSSTGWFNLGELYMRLEMNDKAIESFDFATAINEDYAHSYFNKAIIFANQGDYLSALNAFKECAEYEGVNPLTLCYIGECYEKLDDYNLALSYYDQVIEIDDRWSDAWMGKAVVYELMGEDKQALKMIKKAIESLPENAEYRLLQARVYDHLGNEIEAEKAYEKVIELNPDEKEPWLDYAGFLDKIGKVNLAIEILLEGLAMTEDYPEFFYRLCACMLKAGREAEALMFLGDGLLEDYEKYPSLFNYYPEAQNNLNVNQLIEIYKPE